MEEKDPLPPPPPPQCINNHRLWPQEAWPPRTHVIAVSSQGGRRLPEALQIWAGWALLAPGEPPALLILASFSSPVPGHTPVTPELIPLRPGFSERF